MTSRERVLMAIAHQEADRVPVGFECHDDLQQKLIAHYGAADRLDLFRKLGIDGFSVFHESYVFPKYIGPPVKVLDDGATCDFWGIDCHQRNLPLASCETVADLGRYPWPSADWFDCSEVHARCLAIKKLGLPAVGGEGGCGIQHAINLRGFEQALIDPLADPDFTHAYLQRAGDFFVEWNDRWLAAAATSSAAASASPTTSPSKTSLPCTRPPSNTAATDETPEPQPPPRAWRSSAARPP